MVTIELKGRISSSFEGYSALLELDRKCNEYRLELITIDFTSVVWFDANLCAVLGALINKWQLNLNSISLINISQPINTIFSKNWFLKSFGADAIIDTNLTTIKYKRYELKDGATFLKDLQQGLLSHKDFVNLSAEASKLLSKTFLEIFMNASHSGSDQVFSCGQYFPNNTPPKFDFTIVDIGTTIKMNVERHLRQNIGGVEAIKWALEKGNTTKLKEEGVPGGLGLAIIKDFITLNRGKLQIISDDFCYEIANGIESPNNFACGTIFAGTIVNVEFNLNDQTRYITTAEKNKDIKF